MVRKKSGHGPAKTGHGPGRENEVDTVPVQFRYMVFVENNHKIYIFWLNALREFMSFTCLINHIYNNLIH